MFGCGTSRRTKGVGIWKLPNAKDEAHKKNGGKIGSGKLRRQEKLIATRCLHAKKTFIVKIWKHVGNKIKQILVKYIANLW